MDWIENKEKIPDWNDWLLDDIDVNSAWEIWKKVQTDLEGYNWPWKWLWWVNNSEWGWRWLDISEDTPWWWTDLEGYSWPWKWLWWVDWSEDTIANDRGNEDTTSDEFDVSEDTPSRLWETDLDWWWAGWSWTWWSGNSEWGWR